MKVLALSVTLLCGVLFSRPASAALTVLHAFIGNSADDGGGAHSGVVISGSTLFGTTEAGGAAFDGTVYKVNMDGSGFRLIHSFDRSVRDGGQPQSDLILSGQTLYGTTAGGGANLQGTVFKLNTDGSGYQLLHEFAGGADDGSEPYAGLAVNGDTLYGTTAVGGPSNIGTLFRVKMDGSGYEVLHGFNGGTNDGAYPIAGLTFGGGALYGTTSGGGESNRGTVFKMNTDGTGFQLLRSFAGTTTEGGDSWGNLALDGSTLYGTTASYGVAGRGTVFKLNADGTGFQTLHSFVGGENDGRFPTAGVTVRGRSLFGTTLAGGVRNLGVAYRVNTDGTEFAVLHSFDNSSSGDSPSSSVSFSGSTLFGTTLGLATSPLSTLFALTVPESLAFTRFSEPAVGAADYVPDIGDEEMGFASVQQSTGGVNPLVGISGAGANRILTHRSLYAKTTFDAVDLFGLAEVEVSVELQVANTGYEVGDGVGITVTNGTQEIVLFYQEAVAGTDQLDNLAGDGFVTFSAFLPASWTTAQLVIESSSNSTTGAERYDFDNIEFSGVLIPVPEPASNCLMLLGMIVSVIVCRSRR